MPKLQTNAQHDFRYETIARAEGEECIICHIEHFVPRPRRRPALGLSNGSRHAYKRLEIEHADSIWTNWAWSNLHLVCHKHNCWLRNLPVLKHLSLMRSYSVQLEKERDRENLPTWKTVLKDMIPYRDGSPEMKANRLFKTPWSNYVNDKLRERGSMFKKEIIREAARACGCSKQTSINYLEVDTAANGPYKETFDQDGNTIIVFRELPVRLLPPSVPKGVRSRLAGQGDSSGNDGWRA